MQIDWTFTWNFFVASAFVTVFWAVVGGFFGALQAWLDR